MIRRILSMFLVAVMLVSMVPSSVFATESEPVVQDQQTPAEQTQETAEEESTQPPEETTQPPEETTQDEAVEAASDEGVEPQAEHTTTTISGNVIWVNRDQQSSSSRPTSVKLTLYADGVATSNVITVSDNGEETWPFTFGEVPSKAEDGHVITYTVVEDAIDRYEITYSADTLTITNSFLGASLTTHSFGHIDVRIAGATLEFTHVVKDADGVIISSSTESIVAYVTNVEYVILDGVTYSSFQQDGDYEFRTTSMRLGIELTESSTATIVVDLVDENDKIYEDVEITYGLGGIMDAAYECDGYRNGSFDGLDFIVGAAQNYTIEATSYGAGITVQKYIQEGAETYAFSGVGGEFTFQLVEMLVEDDVQTPTGRSWQLTNGEDGMAKFAITYDYTSEEELRALNNVTYAYVLTEVAGSGDYVYDTTSRTISVTLVVDEDENGNLTLMPNYNSKAIYTFTNVLKTLQIQGTKTWDDNDDQDGIRPAQIVVRLLADGVEIDRQTVSAETNWSWDFGYLPEYRNGVKIIYTVAEEPVAGYEATADGFNLTNTHTPEVVNVEVVKTWDDNNNQDGLRPQSITVHLLANGVDTGETLILTGSDWKGSFENLPKYENGAEIKYTVTEDEVTGYTTTIVGTNITNAHTPATVDISGSKTWVDNDNQDGIRPASITINLLADGAVVATKTVTAADGWAWTFKDLPKYNQGKQITYTVTEDQVDNYSTTYNGTNVINSYTPKETSVTVSKVWEDANNQDGIRPNDITVKLLADGEDTGKTLVLSSGNGWTGSFTGLPVNKSGVAIVYTVEEVSVAGYETVITGDASVGYTITNTHTPETVKVEGKKTWDDNNNQDGARPEFITIHLLADGEVVKTITVTAENGWAWSFDNLPKNKAGVKIRYSITEDAVEDYTTEVDGYNVTNTHAPAKTSVSVSKAWYDNNDQDGIRANDVTVKLLADGVDTGKTLVLNAGNSWTGTFTDLDKFAAGTEITYTVEEVTISGYTTVITGDAKTGYTIKNTHEPAVVSISGNKTWDDNFNQDGKQPESITIRLLADGVEVDSKTVNEADGWVWSFENLPKYKDHGTEIVYSITEDAVTDYITTYNGTNVINTHAPEKTSVTVSKAWVDSNDQDGIRPNDVTIELLANGEPTGKTLVLNSGNNWTGSFTDLDVYAEGTAIEYTVAELVVEGYSTVITGDAATGFTVTNSHTTETVEVAGAKTWEDNDDQDGKRPATITINLLADGEIIDTKEVSEADGWAWSFVNLPKYKNHGTEIVYSITETSVEDYVTTYNGFNVTNTHAPAKTSVTVTKSWQDNDNQDGIRPNDITVVLVANDEPTDKTLVLNQGNNWTGSFTDLDKFANGEEVVYTVQELTVAGYSSVITGSHANGFTITNSHTPEVISFSGAKTWEDNDDQDGKRPASITINLLADGQIKETITVTEADGWAWSFENLPKYRDHGTLIVYTITEDVVDGYTTEVSGGNVVNTHAPEKTSVTVTKHWEDSNDQDGIRPNDITVTLYADGEATEYTLTLSSGNSWTGTFTDLDVYKAGKKIVYTVAENEVPDYQVVISGDAATGFIITNSHTPETVSVEGSKTWNDNNNQDGFRPESITVNLLADGKVVDTITVTEADGWAWSFENLPKYKDHGTEIVYTITEETVDEYSTSYNGFNIVNDHTLHKTSVTVSKAWVDSNNQDGIRPNEITVVLVANDVATDKTLVLSAGNGWTGSFTDLDKYENGQVITYTVQELSVDGYSTVISGDQTSGYSITNSHTPETVAVSGAKTWEDNFNQDGKRPESITINLLADGVVIDTITVTEADGWAWSFENLPKYRDHGTPIVYSVTEEAVDEYTTEYNGYDVTNTHAPEKTSVTVSKAWADNDDQDGIRPADITVKLLANGKDTGKTLLLSSGNFWTGSFTDLDKYENGKVITYTVEEIAIDGYTTVITGDQTVGYTITNSHNPEVVSFSGKKTWDDKNDQDGDRPVSITIHLLADGKVIDTKIVIEADGWAWTFENLPKYRDHGTEIVYSIIEDAVDEYSTEYDGFNITNTHTPEQTSITVTKAWADNNDQDGIRPESVTVKLLANGEDTGKTLKLSADNSWTGSFTELDKFADGKEIRYTVEEVSVEGYTTVITGDKTTGFTITNSHTPEVISISGSKTWNDNNNQDGVRPESITINLLSNGTLIKSVTVTEADNWSWTFTNLPKYQNGGVEIVYAITEERVEGYTTTYDGYDVINSYTPAEVSVTVTKAWDDGDDQDGYRPDEITITLYANGKLTDKTLVLTAEDNWSGSFVGLPKYEAGVEIVYTIGELEVEEYNTVIRGTMTDGFVVTNSRTVNPPTGDNSTPVLWVGMMGLSALVFILLAADNRRRRNHA